MKITHESNNESHTLTIKCKNGKQSKDSYGQKNYIEIIIVFVKISKQLWKESSSSI